MADKAPQPSPAPVFPGFDVPRQNWFKMPNAWTDITAGITSLAELKVIEYVLKHTWGYREYGIAKLITTNEFMQGRRRKDGTRIDRGTGLSKPSVIAGLKAAVAHGFLEELVDDSDRGRIKKSYSLKMLPGLTSDDDTDEPVESPPPPPDEAPDERGVKHLNADVKNLDIEVKHVDIKGKESLHRSEKDTLERQQQTDTTSNNSVNTGGANEAQETDVVVATLLSKGISRSVARRLARTYPADYLALKQEYLEFLLAERPDELKKPAGVATQSHRRRLQRPRRLYFPRRAGIAMQRKKNAENRPIAEALERQRTAIEAEQQLRNEARSKWQQRLRQRFSTTPADEKTWEHTLQELRFGGMDLADLSLIADAQILTVSDDRLQLGVARPAKLREIQHPAYLKRLQRAARAATGKTLEIDLVAIDPPPA